MTTRSGDSRSAVIAFLLRYGIGTMTTFRAGPCSAMSDKGSERLITSMLREGSIESYPLMNATRYYVASADAAKARGIHDGRASMALGSQALLQNYAIMSACVLCEPRRERLTRDEFGAKFPMLLRNGRPLKHYRTRHFIDRADGAVRLGLFVIDLGISTRRIVSKARREIDRKRAGLYAPFIDQRLLSVCLLTAFDAKAAQIRNALSGFSAPLVVQVVPGFSSMISS